MKDYTFPDCMVTVRPQFTGLRIITDINMTETVEDWSRVRSPSRAKRRRKLGHRQNIEWRTVPRKDAFRIGNDLVMHPETKKAFEALMAKQAAEIHDRLLKEACGFGESAAVIRESDGALTMEQIERARRLLW